MDRGGTPDGVEEFPGWVVGRLVGGPFAIDDFVEFGVGSDLMERERHSFDSTVIEINKYTSMTWVIMR